MFTMLRKLYNIRDINLIYLKCIREKVFIIVFHRNIISICVCVIKVKGLSEITLNNNFYTWQFLNDKKTVL